MYIFRQSEFFSAQNVILKLWNCVNCGYSYVPEVYIICICLRSKQNYLKVMYTHRCILSKQIFNLALSIKPLNQIDGNWPTKKGKTIKMKVLQIFL